MRGRSDDDFTSVLVSSPPEAAQRSVFEFDTLATFLQHHVEQQRRRDRSWSVRRWCRELDHRHGTTLSRVIVGQRAPGDQLAAQLTAYFRFAGLEAQYFGCLVEEARARASSLGALLAIGRRELRARVATAATDDPPILEMRGAIVALQGDVDAAAATRLVPEGAPVTPLAIGTRVPVSVSACAYHDTTAGPYAERYIALAMRRTTPGPVEWGMWFLHRMCTSKRLAIVGQAMLGLDPDVATIDVAIDERGARATVDDGTGPTTLAFERATPTAPTPLAIQIVGFGRSPLGWCSYHLATAGQKWEVPVAPGDRIELVARDRALLAELDFQPRLWSIAPVLDSTMLAPRRLG
jgi:hypothetical protein